EPFLGPNKRAFVAAAHGDGGVEVLPVEVMQSFRLMGREIVADRLHRLDCFRVDAPRRPGAGAERLDLPGTLDAGEGLRHLASITVLDADKDNPLHELASRGTGQQQPGSCTHRHARTPASAPRTGAVR